MKPFIPVTGGADQDEEEDVDGESVKNSCDGAFGDGNTRSPQLPFMDMFVQHTHNGLLSCDVYKTELMFEMILLGVVCMT